MGEVVALMEYHSVLANVELLKGLFLFLFLSKELGRYARLFIQYSTAKRVHGIARMPIQIIPAP